MEARGEARSALIVMSSSSSSGRNYGTLDSDDDDIIRTEGIFQNLPVAEAISDTIPSSAPSSSSPRSSGRIVTTVIAVLMAMAGATIMLSYGHSSDVTGGGMQFSFYGRPMMGSSTVVGAPPTHEKTLTIKKNNDGVGNVIFDYETTSALDLYKTGETVIECIQVCMSLSLGIIAYHVH